MCPVCMAAAAVVAAKAASAGGLTVLAVKTIRAKTKTKMSAMTEPQETPHEPTEDRVR